MAAARGPVRGAARDNAMADGFLGRWAQRKADARQGKPLVEPELPRSASPPEKPAPAVSVATPTSPPGAENPAPSAPPLTLQDAEALDKDSDFKPFIDRSVDPTVRNAAMKKLFADPHYNVMDGLDTYIDDYSKPDPLPLSMLQKMASAQFLKLVDGEDGEGEDGAQLQTPPPPAAVAGETTTTTRDNHAHTDLRLQPDHAPGTPDPGRGAE